MPAKPEDDDEASSFTQEYDPRADEAKRLVIYCRLCRRVFPVTFKPRPTARLRCLCGHEAPLSELDVFETDERARDFANLYQKLFSAAKQALRDANLPVPPTGRFDRIRDGDDPPSDIAEPSDSPEDMSDITSSYVGDGSDEREGDKEEDLRRAVEEAKDVLAKHDALSELVEHLYCVRHAGTGAFDRFRNACVEDMGLAKEVVAEATRRKKAGKKVRVTFSSFKHLAIALEDEGDVKGALDVCEAAKALGLPGYDERASKLRAALPATKPAEPATPESLAVRARLTASRATEADEREALPPRAGEACHRERRDRLAKRSRDAFEVPTLGASGSVPALESKPAKLPSSGSQPALEGKPEKLPSSGSQPALEGKPAKQASSASQPALGSKPAVEGKPAVESKPTPRPAPAPPPDEESDPIGLLSSSSDAIIPASADLEDLLPPDES